jgi:glycosyltransferase involved in cell wall biosynthesis
MRHRDLPQVLKILIYGQVPPPHHGSNIMTEFFIRALKKLGYDVRLSPKNFSRTIGEVNKTSAIKPGRVLSAFGRYLKNFLNFKPDLVVFFTSSRKIGLLVDAPFVLAARIAGIPYVHYIHTQGPFRIYARGGPGRVLIKSLIDKASACLVLGEIFKEQIRVFYGGPIHVLPNCLEGSWNPAARTEDPDRPVNVIFLSNIHRAKGILTLIKAIPLVLAEHPRARFIIAGPWQDQDLRDEVMASVKELGLEQNVQFPGPVYGQAKTELLSRGDIFVLPSDYEAFAIVNLEAMRAGLPVITTAVGAMPDVILDGRSGFLISPKRADLLAEKLNLLVENAALRKAMGAEGRRQFEKLFSFSSYTLRLGEIMSEIIDKGTP